MTPLFSTAYFPPVAYMAAIIKCDEALIEVKETFPKQTFRNRMEIMTAGGVRTLTVPVLRDNHSRTETVGIDYRERWNVTHLRTLTAAYSASPYFLYYKDDIEVMLMKHYGGLIELNDTILKWLLGKLKSGCHIECTADFMPHNGDVLDYRSRFTPKKPYPTDGMKPYYQVFSDRLPFTPNLSVLDLLMNLGPESRDYLYSIENEKAVDDKLRGI